MSKLHSGDSPSDSLSVRGASAEFDAFWSEAVAARTESLRAAEPNGRDLAAVRGRILTASPFDFRAYLIRTAGAATGAGALGLAGAWLALHPAPRVASSARTSAAQARAAPSPGFSTLPAVANWEPTPSEPMLEEPSSAFSGAAPPNRSGRVASAPIPSARPPALVPALRPQPRAVAPASRQAPARSSRIAASVAVGAELATGTGSSSAPALPPSEAVAVAQILAALNVAGEPRTALRAIADYRRDFPGGRLQGAVVGAEVAADLKLGRSDEALACLERAAQSPGVAGDLELEATRAELLEQRGRRPEARAVWQSLLSAQLSPALRSRVIAALSTDSG